MSHAETEALKQHLIANDTHFAELVNTHREYDKRLIELEELHYPSTEEQMEEAMLKRKKLQLKDEMEAIMRRYKEQHQTAGH
jgi:uncharacterized protein YdcH (DUF465 family)